MTYRRHRDPRCRRRQGDRVWGGSIPLPSGLRSGTPLQRIFKFYSRKWYILCILTCFNQSLKQKGIKGQGHIRSTVKALALPFGRRARAGVARLEPKGGSPSPLPPEVGRGGTKVLKVEDKFYERSEQKIFFIAHFLGRGGTKYGFDISVKAL